MIQPQNGKKQNPKAFAFSSIVKAKCLQSRSIEKEQRRLHVPTYDCSYGKQAQYVVVVHRSPKVHNAGVGDYSLDAQFRITVTAVCLSSTTRITSSEELKLGHPCKIFKNTAHAAKEEIGNQPKRWVDNQKERLLGALRGQNFDADNVFFPAWTRVEVPLFTTH
ncbi:hypothetical protein DVH24_015851 [Malus domestica]|uniref:Uncharacterized protein n=1 Tax=Malus domestica TaxID=3750 RepID=A0A498JIG0_MALDO|nr:hypothetical protein DVH24_015851 [Malus domestica]